MDKECTAAALHGQFLVSHNGTPHLASTRDEKHSWKQENCQHLRLQNFEKKIFLPNELFIAASRDTHYSQSPLLVQKFIYYLEG